MFHIPVCLFKENMAKIMYAHNGILGRTREKRSREEDGLLDTIPGKIANRVI